MGRRPVITKSPRKHISATLPDELAGELHKFMINNEIGSYQDATRLLLYMALSATAKDGTEVWKMRVAFQEIRIWLMTEVGRHLAEIKLQLEETIRMNQMLAANADSQQTAQTPQENHQ